MITKTIKFYIYPKPEISPRIIRAEKQKINLDFKSWNKSDDVIINFNLTIHPNSRDDIKFSSGSPQLISFNKEVSKTNTQLSKGFTIKRKKEVDKETIVTIILEGSNSKTNKYSRTLNLILKP